MLDKSDPYEDEILSRLFNLTTNHLSAQNSGPFLNYQNPSDLEKKLELDLPEGNEDWEQIFFYIEKYLTYAVKTNHTGFSNRMWSGANLTSIIGEMISAISNTCASTYESAPVSTLIEKYMIKQMLELVGFEKGEGQMTTGSSNANMIAMLAARNGVNSTIKTKGLFLQPQLYAFVSQDAHYSLDKAANIIGIGIDHLIKVKVKANGEMDLKDLEASIQTVKQFGGIPFFVAGTAGTTLRGAYDNIKGLLKLKDKYAFWLHVDGAWGGAAILSEKLRNNFLKNIEHVDSFTWDFHKMLGTAMICNVLLFNHNPGTLNQLCSAGNTSYIFRDDPEHYDETFNLGSFSLQCGRKVDSLKWFLDWKFNGRVGFAKKVERFYQLCQKAENIITSIPELEMLVPRSSFNLCFRYKVPDHISKNDFNLKLRTELYHNGISLIGFGYIKTDLCLRLLITNPKINEETLGSFFNSIVKTGNKLMVTA